MFKSLKAPRYCDVTRQPMFEGWVTEDYLYIKNEQDALEHAKELGYASLQEAYDDEHMYWTSWADEPELDWDPIPQDVLLQASIQITQDLLETVEDHDCMPEVVNSYQQLLNTFKTLLP